MSWLRRWSSPLHTHDSYYYTSYSDASDDHAPHENDTRCLLQFRLNDWSDCLLIAFCGMLWNASIILWLMPWRHRFPSLAVSMQPLFRSHNYGVSLQHWKQMGSYTGVLMQRLVGKADFEAYISVLTVLCLCSMVSKVLLFLSLNVGYKNYSQLYADEGVYKFVNGQTILVSLLFVSDWFFLLADTPQNLLQQRKLANPSLRTKIAVVVFKVQVIITVVMLAFKWKFLAMAAVVSLSIAVALRLVGMATLCFLPTVGFVGAVVYWTLRALGYPLTVFRGEEYWKHRIREYSSAITWLIVTFFAWTSAFALLLLFTNPRFDSVMCLDIDSKAAVAVLLFQLTIFIMTVLLIYAFGVMDSMQWKSENLRCMTLFCGFSCKNARPVRFPVHAPMQGAANGTPASASAEPRMMGVLEALADLASADATGALTAAADSEESPLIVHSSP